MAMPILQLSNMYDNSGHIKFIDVEAWLSKVLSMHENFGRLYANVIVVL